MTDIPINDVTRRVQFTGNTTTGPFAFTFNILTASDIDVYKNDTLQTLTTHYTVSINANGTGSVTLTSALVATDVLTIIGGRAIARTTDFVTAGDLLASSLNEQLDSLVIMSQQLSERIDRTIIANPGDNNVDLTLPVKADRASKIVAFDTNGDLSLGTSSSLELTLDTVDINTITTNLIDGVGGDLIIKPFGSQVNIVGTSGEQRITFSAVTSPTMTMFSADGNSIGLALPSGNPTAARTIRFPDADGNVALTNQNTLTPTGDFTVDASGDIILDADGAQVYFKDAGTTNFTFQLGGVPKIQANGTGLMIENSSSGIDFKSASGLYDFLSNTGDQVVQLIGNVGDPSIKFYKSSNTLTLNAPSSITGTRTITLPDASGSVMLNVVEDTSPQLGGTLDLNGNRIEDDVQVYIKGTGSADIDLQAAGGQVNILGTSGEQRILFNNDATPEIKIFQNSNTLTLDVATLTNTRTLTLPDATDTLVGKATTDTLTNKTLTSAVLNSTISGTSIKDEDDMSSDSASHLATQQSIKAYVDANAGSGDLNNVLTSGNTTGGVNIVFGDSSGASDDRLVFGAGSDLQIYHDGSNSYIRENGTGDLLIQASNIQLEDPDGNNYLRGVDGGILQLYHSGTEVMRTTSTGVDVTGRITTDGITSSGTYVVESTSYFVGNATNGYRFNNAADTSNLFVIKDSGNVGIGLSNPQDYYAETLVVGATANEAGITIKANSTTDTNYLMFADGTSGNAAYRGYIGYTHNSPEYLSLVSYGHMRFYTSSNGSTTIRAMDIDTDGDVGIGVVHGSIDSKLHVDCGAPSSSDKTIAKFQSQSTRQIGFVWDDSASTLGVATLTNHAMVFHTNGNSSERMRIGSSGGIFFHGITGRATGSTGHISITEQTNNRSYFESATTTTASTTLMAFLNPNGVVGSIVVGGSATSYNTSSDYRLKENVVNLTGATERLKQLEPKRFNFIADADTTVDGFLAHEVQDIVPEAITGTKDAMRDEEYEVTPAVLDDDGNVVTEAVMGTRSVPDYQGIDQSKLVPLLVATIKELEARITALEAN